MINSVLFPKVVIENNAVIKDSIIMQDSIVKYSSLVTRAIIDEEAVVEENCTIGGENKITVIGKRSAHKKKDQSSKKAGRSIRGWFQNTNTEKNNEVSK